MSKKTLKKLFGVEVGLSCITNHKDTILKANHNPKAEEIERILAVLPITKIQF